MELLTHTLHGLMTRTAAKHPLHRAIVFGGRTLTFAEFDSATDRLAAALAARGVTSGDRIGLYCMNSDAFALAYFGILKAGAVVVPINLLLNPKEVAFILQDAGATGLIYHEAFAAAVQAAGFPVHGSGFRVCIGEKNPLADIPFSSAINHEPVTIPSSPSDLAVILVDARYGVLTQTRRHSFIASLMVVKLPPPTPLRTAARVGRSPASARACAAAQISSLLAMLLSSLRNM